ncbi:MAG: pilus assembly protein [Alphaproteobacteria bacterium]|nr:pilus assembly protein [Alphaproteobacteria bacterium]
MNPRRPFRNFWSAWRRDESGLAAAEAGLIFPILLVLLLGTFDMGNALLAGQKTIRASQVTADLITRERSVTTDQITEAVEAGELALQPYATDTYGVDIVSVEFDEDAEPQIVWRETRNMTPVPDVLTAVDALAEPDGGVLVVTVQYLFEPVFSNFVIGDIAMQERAFSRGRRSAVVNRE